MAPSGVLPTDATVVANVPLELRERPHLDATVTAAVAVGDRLTITGPLLVDGERWYHLSPVDDQGGAGHAVLDPAAGTVEVLPFACPAQAPTLAELMTRSGWESLACFGDRELTIEGYPVFGMGGFRPGRYEPAWLNGFAGALAVIPAGGDQGDGGGLSVYWARVEPGDPRIALPSPSGDIGTDLLRLTGHFNHPASATCRTLDIPIGGDAQRPTAEMEPIAAELACRERFVLTDLVVVDAGAGFDDRMPRLGAPLAIDSRLASDAP